jgi:catechol 2,3-dioxygenase-like lactoylglutathione lyase family enzyme
MADWQASTLVFVRDIDASIAFYVGQLGFSLNMRYEEEGAALVAGVSHGEGFPLLLTSQWPEKAGTAVFYCAFGRDEFADLQSALAAKGVAASDGWWGRKLLIVTDPDGNQIWFADPTDPASE